MNAELFTSLDLLEKESGISKEYMLSKIEEALANACRKENRNISSANRISHLSEVLKK